jgi:hypothetical protein
MSAETPEGPPLFDLTDSGKAKVEAEPNVPPVNPTPEQVEAANEQADEPKDVLNVRLVTDPVPPTPEVETEDVEKEFYHVQELDPMRLVPGTNPYLDQVERERGEIQRAKIEDREPDLENPPAVQSTLVLTKEVVENSGLSTADVNPASVLEVPQVVQA